VVYDSDDSNQRGIGPVRSLLTAFGACSGMDVVAILKKRKQKVTALRVMLTGERPKYGPAKPWNTIHAKYIVAGEALERKYVEEAVRDSAQRFCSVGANLRPTTKITHSFEIVG